MNNPNAPTLELGSWLGGSQAFGMVSNHCSAAQAKCLQEIRDSDAYKSPGLTWEEFCPAYTGLSRKQIDAIIGSLQAIAARRGRITADRAGRFFTQIATFNFRIAPAPAVADFARLSLLASRFHLTSYDTAYLDLAVGDSR